MANTGVTVKGSHKRAPVLGTGMRVEGVESVCVWRGRPWQGRCREESAKAFKGGKGVKV